MSLDYYVVCRDSLPARAGGWSLTVGPVAISEVNAAEHGAAVKAAGGAAVQLLVLNCPSAGGTVAEAMGMVLARAARGAVVYEDGPEVLDDFKELPPSKATAADLEQKLGEVISQAREASAQEAAQEKAEFDDLEKTDPRAVKEANDWSDV